MENNEDFRKQAEKIYQEENKRNPEGSRVEGDKVVVRTVKPQKVVKR